MRPAILVAVAWRDLRRVFSGRQRLGLPAVAAMLLLPVGALPLHRAPSTAAPQGAAAAVERMEQLPAVVGPVPEALEGRVRFDAAAEVMVVSTDPVLVVRGSRLSPDLRAALDTLPGPGVEVRHHRTPLRLPGRSLLVALLAISLLIGPLAESLPGEREEGTLETLLSAALSRGELITGKWLAWTTAASGAALLSLASGRLTGVPHVGLWVLGIPLSVGVAVAVGLWLVRHAGDVIGGAAAPMRVLPAVALVSLGGAWALAAQAPLLSAAVPLGGALLLSSGGLDPRPATLAISVLSAALTVGGMLGLTARALDRPPPVALGRGGGLLALAAIAWWLPVAGPALWSRVDRAELVDPQAGLQAAAVLLLVFAGSDRLQDTRPASPLRAPGEGRSRDALVGTGVALVLGGLLALLSGGVPLLLSEGALAERLQTPPEGLGRALLLAVGQEAMFRGALVRRLGPVAAALAWVVVVCPADPLMGAFSAVGLGLLARRWGLAAAILAAWIWRIA